MLPTDPQVKMACHLGDSTLTRYGIGGVKMARRPLYLSDPLLFQVRL